MGHQVDEAGEEVGLTYSGQLTDSETGDVTTGEWMAWSQANDVLGRVRTDATTFATQIATSAGITPDADTTEATAGNPLDFDHRYTYDKAGNLSKVEDLTGLPVDGNMASPYTVREYGFTTNGARKSSKETIRADNTVTGTPTAGVNQTLTYDTADRPIGGYAYDALGRQTTVPEADAPDASSGDITLGYFDGDLPQKVAQNGTETTFTLDVAKRRLVQSSATGSEKTTTTRHYTDESDNPAWTETVRPDGSSETLRYTSSISGKVGASVAADGGVSLMLPNIHGDTVTSVPIPAGVAGTEAATAIVGWATYTEFGTPVDGEQATTVGTSSGYGWLGAKGRSNTADTAGLTLMGVRFYNRTTGAFTSPDAISGGNATAYNCPTDPINECDASGLASRKRTAHNKNWRYSRTKSSKKSWGRRSGSERPAMPPSGFSRFEESILSVSRSRVRSGDTGSSGPSRSAATAEGGSTDTAAQTIARRRMSSPSRPSTTPDGQGRSICLRRRGERQGGCTRGSLEIWPSQTWPCKPPRHLFAPTNVNLEDSS